MMDIVSKINVIYESMNISKSIVVCDSEGDMFGLFELLNESSYPCVFSCSLRKDTLKDLPNQMILVLKEDFNSLCFKELIYGENISCVIFTSLQTFKMSVQTIVVDFDLMNSPKFIFTL